MDEKSGFPPETYSTSYNLRNEIKQYLIKKGLAFFHNGVLTPTNNHIKKREVVRETHGDHKCCTKHKFLCWSGDHKRAVTQSSCTKKVRKRDEEHSLLKFLALNALELTAPASDVLLRQGGNQTTTGSNSTCAGNQWFQLSGHPDAFAPAGPGTVWKKCSGGTERAVYEALSMEPALQDVTPRYLREVQYGGQTFIELEDLLHSFRDPNVMDIKMGRRTFLEDEVQNTKAREDLYNKMVAVDPTAPTEEEHEQKAITKLRYMQFREEQSSTCSHGFRIEAMKFRGSPPVTDLKCVKSDAQVLDAISLFLGNREDVRQRLLVRLNEIRTKLESSKYFKQHEVVGSSLLLMYDDSKVGAWLIDFAKTRPVPTNMTVNHRSAWSPGNHEEGFLYGLDQLIRVLEKVRTGGEQRSPPPTTPVALKS
ncbi:inositol-trisphosphate 3-kinase homolog isoform X2 [Macrosteles quadrilineatus]|uniref:inositol-trisphosphate 3-kinase homolog isoform X2 n=1 Tax=Macrosteles quadrilineatus TaxID=74068 RepID=UPI0023E0E1B1|nr:inositol-trisphosphate 3-kinase homolog isoform X2 [Macrosteles quadrilineatus]